MPYLRNSIEKMPHVAGDFDTSIDDHRNGAIMIAELINSQNPNKAIPGVDKGIFMRMGRSPMPSVAKGVFLRMGRNVSKKHSNPWKTLRKMLAKHKDELSTDMRA